MSLRFRSALVVLTSAAALLLLPGSALAATCTPGAEAVFDGDTSTAWEIGDNWVAGVAPQIGDDVCIPDTQTAVVSTFGALGNVSLEVAGTLVIAGSATLGPAPLSFDVLAGAQVEQQVALTIPNGLTIDNAGTWEVGNADLSATGTGRFVNATGGVFERTSSSSWQWQQNFDNHGTFRAILNVGSSGFTQLPTGGDHTGGRFEIGGTFVGSPELQLAGGPHSISGATFARVSGATTGRHVIVSGTTIDAAGGGVVVDAPLTSAGVWQVAATGTFDVAQSDVPELTITGGGLTGSGLLVPSGFTIRQTTSLGLLAAFDVTNHGDWLVTNGGITSSGGRFINASDGELVHTTSSSWYAVRNLDNHGLFRAIVDNGSSGWVVLDTSGDHTGGRFEVGGSFVGPAELQFAGGTHLLTNAIFAHVDDTTNGIVRNVSGTILDLEDGGLRLDAPLVNGGTWLVDDTAPFHASSLEKTIVWTGGLFSGSEFVVADGWTFDQRTGITIPSGFQFTNHGTWLVGNSSITSSGGRFVNASDGEFIHTASSSWWQFRNLDNHGLFRAVINAGASGWVTLDTSGDHTGGRFEIGGTFVGTPEIQFAGGTHVMKDATVARVSGDAAGQILNVSGTILDLRDGGLRLDAPLANGGTWLVDATEPFHADSAQKTIVWTGGLFSGSEFVVADGWTFDQRTGITIPSGFQFTNHGTWLVGNSTIVSSGGRFVNASDGEFVHTATSSWNTFRNLDNHGLFRAVIDTGSSGWVALDTSGDHTGGRFEVGGTFVGTPEIQFAGGTHVMTNATFARVAGNTTGRVLNVSGTVLDLQGGGLRLDAPLANGGTWLVDATEPFHADSTQKTIVWTGGLFSGSEFVVADGWTFDQRTGITIPSGFQFTNHGTWLVGNSSIVSSGGRFVNASDGEFIHTATSSWWQFRNFDNHGLFRATIDVGASGWTVFDTNGDHTGGRFEVGGSFVGTPEVQFASGTHELTGATVARSAGNTTGAVVDTGADIVVDDGTSLTVNAPFTVNDKLADGALTIGGTGELRVANALPLSGSGALNVVAGATLHLTGVVDTATRTVANAGTILIAGPATVSGSGTWSNTGTIRSTGNATVVPPVVNAGGTVDLDSGVLVLDTSASTLADGDWFVGAGAELEAGDGVTSVEGDLTLEGAGSALTNASVADVSGSIIAAADASITLADDAEVSGTLTALGSIEANDLVLDGGTAGGAGSLALHGTTLVKPGSMLDLSVGSRVLEALTNGGTTNVGTADVTATGAVTLQSAGTLRVANADPNVGSIAAPTLALGGTLHLVGFGTPTYAGEWTLLTGSAPASDSFAGVTSDVPLVAPFTWRAFVDGPVVKVEVDETTLPSTPAAATSTSPAVNVAKVANRVEVTWPASIDTGSGIFGYSVQLDDQLAQFEAAPTVAFTSVPVGTHTVKVTALDREGNRSATTTYGPFVLTTAPTVGTLASSTPAVSTPTVTSSVTATWNAAAATGIPIAGYRRAISTTQGATPTGAAANTTTETFTGLAAGTYWVNVVAVDTDGNASAVRAFGPFELAAEPVVVPPVVVPPVVVPPVVVPPVVDPPKDTTPPKVGTVPTPTVAANGVVTIKVPACPATEASCNGSVKMETKVASTLLKAKKPKLVNFVLGLAKFTAKGGQTASVKLTLSKQAKAVLKKAKVLKVTTTITVTDAAGNKTVVKKTLTLKAPKKLR